MSRDYSSLTNVPVFSTYHWPYLQVALFHCLAQLSALREEYHWYIMSGSQTIPTALLCETPETSSNFTNGGTAQEISNSAGHPSLLAPPLLLGRKKKIVLHIDLNNTILVSDAVTKQGTVAALEYFLSTVTWGRMTKGEI